MLVLITVRRNRAGLGLLTYVILLSDFKNVSVRGEGIVAVDDYGLQGRVLQVDRHRDTVDEPLHQAIRRLHIGGEIRVEAYYQILGCVLRHGGWDPGNNI